MSELQLKEDRQKFIEHIDILIKEVWMDKSRSW